MSGQLFPVSLQQARRWRQSANGRGSLRLVAPISGPLQPERLIAVFADWVASHEIARTDYVLSGLKLPLQRILDSLAVDWRKETWPTAMRDARIAAFLASDAPGERLQPWLVRLDEQEHLLLLDLPALSFDQRAAAMVLAELAQRYAGQTPEAPLQYADYVAWQEQNHQPGPETEAAEAYLDQLAALPTATTLALGPTRVRVERALSDREAQTLRTLAQACDLAPADLVLLCFHHLLSRLGEPSPRVFGQVWDGRGFEDLEQAVGLYESVLPQVYAERPGPLAARVGPHREASARLRDLRDHLDLGRLDYAIVCGRVAPGPAIAGGGLNWGPPVCAGGEEPCALRLNYINGDVPRLALEAGSDQADQLLERLYHLLCAVLADPLQPLEALPVLTAAERAQLLLAFNPSPLPETPGFLAAFLIQATAAPQAPALVCEEVAYDYGQLERASRRLAATLSNLGVQPGRETIVALACDRSASALVALLAVLRAGAAYVPADPHLPVARRDAILRDAACPLLIADQPLQLPGLTVLALDTFDWAAPMDTWQEPAPAPESLAYVLFTSGSTGQPKGVAVGHRQLDTYQSAVAARLDLASGHHCGLISTLNADLGYTMLFPSLAQGACLHLLGHAVATDAERLARYQAERPLDFLKIVPSHLAVLMAAGSPAAVLPRRALVLGGEACPVSILAQVRRAAPGLRVFNHYGPTETTVGVMALEQLGLGDEGAHLALGAPLPGARVYLLDRCGQAVPQSQIGEICLAGATLARGYLARPAATAAAFLPFPSAFLPSAPAGARLYRSGDLARFSRAGTLQFLGRADHQVKLRGFRVELGEIEVLLATHPLVLHAVVQLVQEPEHPARLIAYLVGRHALDEADLASIQTHCAAALPDFMVPACFVALPALPLTANGKLDRAALPSPQRARQTHYTPPRNPLETTLCAIWAEVLGLARIGIEDNFFRLGGDSIQCIQIVAKARKAGYQLTVKDVLDSQTVAALAPRARALEETATTDWQGIALDPAQRQSLVARYPDLQAVLPLAPVQDGLLFHSLYEKGSRAYLEQKLLELEGAIEPEALRRAWHSVLDRHEALRAAFVWDLLDRPVQVIVAAAELPWRCEDWCDRPAADQEAAFAAFLAEDRARGFALDRPPLLRVALFRLTPTRFRLVWSHHHLILDGWSVPLVFEDLIAAYRQLAAGAAPEAMARPPYRRYLAWLQARDQAGDERFWRASLAGFSRPTYLAAAAAVSTADVYSDARAQIDRAAFEPLRDWAAAHHLTLNSLVQAAWAMTLARACSADDVVFGTTVSGRPPALDEVERTVGLFINTLPVRLRLGPEPLLDWLRAHQASQFRCADHQHTALARIAKWHALGEGQALFDHLLIFENYPALDHAPNDAFSLHILESDALEKTNYPAIFQVTCQQELSLRLMFDPRHLPPARAAEHLRCFTLALTRFPAAAALPANQVLAQALEATAARHLAERKPSGPNFRAIVPQAVTVAREVCP